MIDVTYVNHMGGDLSVVNAARVSFGKQSSYENGELSEKDRKLIYYLARHKHTSPFGHCFASFHVRAPVFVARQLVKHKFLRWNEISRRYVNTPPEFYQPDWRWATPDKKQGSGEIMDKQWSKPVENKYEQLCKGAARTYRRMLELGTCEEQARMVLPQSMMTEWYWSGSLDAFADMCHLRCKPDTQEETREVAELIEDYMMPLFPVSWEALRAYEE